MVVLFILFLGLLLLSNIYIANGLNLVMLNYLSIKPIYTTIAYIILFILMVVAIIPHINKSRTEELLGMYFMAFTMYLLMFFLISDIGIFIAKFFTEFDKESLRITLYGISLIITLITLIYGSKNAKKIEIINYDADIGLNKNLKAVLLTDIHLGAPRSEKKLPKIVEKVNAINPDVIFIAGDIFDSNFNRLRNREEVVENLKNMKSKLGTYACLGNHDASRTFEIMVDYVKEADIKLLMDEYIRVDDFILGGRIDGTPLGTISTLKRGNDYSIPEEFDAENMPVIVMDHNPVNINKYGDEVDLILAGHTHRGQMFPGNIVTNMLFEVHYGYYEKKNNTKVIVSSGVGTWGMPVRVGSKCEIVTINLK